MTSARWLINYLLWRRGIKNSLRLFIEHKLNTVKSNWLPMKRLIDKSLREYSITKCFTSLGLQCKESKDLVEGEAQMQSYSGMLKKLEMQYYRPRKVFRKVVQGLFPSKMPSDLSKAAEMFRSQVLGTVQQILRSKFCTVEQILIAICETQMSEVCLQNGIATHQR